MCVGQQLWLTIQLNRIMGELKTYLFQNNHHIYTITTNHIFEHSSTKVEVAALKEKIKD